MLGDIVRLFSSIMPSGLGFLYDIFFSCSIVFVFLMAIVSIVGIVNHLKGLLFHG